MAAPGSRIGHIRLTGTLGEGGMGAVFVGVDETLEREVAVKAIRDRHFHAEGRDRFRREARILSQIDHPRICRIYDYLEDDDGHYLVLELIRGRTLRQVMDEGAEPALKMKIALQVAEALVAAHAHGVIHRDLKPDNVMLTPAGEVKVLDFGVSRIFDPDSEGAGRHPRRAAEPETVASEAKTLSTRFGTVAYMSPEQARGEPETPAGDMYTYGLLLHELFTGESPYPRLAAPMVATLAAAGQTQPVTGIDRDLAKLVTRLKSPRPEDRPSASEALAQLRWIARKPQRLVRRLVAAAVAAAVFAFALKYTFDLQRERGLAILAREEAEQARGVAERSRQESEEVVDFLVGLFQLSRPGTASTETLTAREILDIGAREVTRGDLAAEPLTRARLMQTIGNIYRELGLYREAQPLLEQALALRGRELGDRHPDVAESANSLAGLMRAVDRSEEAERLFRQALEILRETLGSDDVRVGDVLNNLATLYRDTGRHAEAEPLFRKALEIYEEKLEPSDPNLAVTLDNLASLYRARGAYELSEPLYERALEIREAALGPDHPDVATTVNNLAALHRIRGDYARAEPFFRRAYEIRLRTLGEEHPRVAISINNLARLYHDQGELARAAPLYRQAIEIYEKRLGRDHRFVAISLHHLGRLYLARGDAQRAGPMLERALDIQLATLGPRHHLVVRNLGSLAWHARQADDETKAEAYLRRALEAGEELIEDEPDNRRGRSELAAVYVERGALQAKRGEREAAQESWSRAVALIEGVAKDFEAVDFLDVYARSLLHLGRISEGGPLARDLLDRGWRGAELVALCRDLGFSEVRSTGSQGAGGR